MRLLALTVLGFAASAIAAPATDAASGAPDITAALTSVKAGVDNIKGAVSAVKSADDKAAIEAVGKKTDELNSVIAAAKTKVEHASPAGIVDALSIAGPASDLANSVGALSTNLASKKAILEKAGEAKNVASALEKQKAGSKGLSDAVLAKLPGLAQPTAKKSAEQIDSSLSSVISTFKSA